MKPTARIRNPYVKQGRTTPRAVVPKTPPLAATAPSGTVYPSEICSLDSSNDAKDTRPKESASALVIAASDKAGMEGIDRNRIDEIILRESGDSLYMQQQRRRDQIVNERIDRLKKKLAQAQRGWEKDLHRQLNAEIPEILAQRPTRSTAAVVDMDSFYMSCELLSKPHLKDRPACVGRGMILTSNYTARTYGVRSAMAGWIGDKLVEELSGGQEKLVHVPSNFTLYKEKSQIVRQVLAEYDPNLKAYSLDEAYMDLAPYLALKLSKGWSHEQITETLAQQKNEKALSDSSAWSEAQVILASFSPAVCLQAADEILHSMRQAVFTATGGLTCSAGLAPNSLLAKIASDRNKPNGQCLVGPDHELDVIPFLYPLPVRKIGGIGRVTEKILQAFDIHTVRDMFDRRALVQFLFQPASAASLLRASLGCCSRDGGRDEHNEDDEETGQKGISRERTFQSGKPWNEINAKLEDIAHLLAADMAGKDLWARTITVKVKLHTFDVLCRSKSLARGVFVREGKDLVSLASEILRALRNECQSPQFSVRLLGIRCSNFKTEGDLATGTFRVEDYFRNASEKSQKAQRRLDSFFAESKNDDDSHTANPASTRPKVVCPVCQQVSFAADDNLRLNRHMDQCLGKSEPTVKKKRKLADFWN